MLLALAKWLQQGKPLLCFRLLQFCLVAVSPWLESLLSVTANVLLGSASSVLLAAMHHHLHQNAAAALTSGCVHQHLMLHALHYFAWSHHGWVDKFANAAI